MCIVKFQKINEETVERWYRGPLSPAIPCPWCQNQAEEIRELWHALFCGNKGGFIDSFMIYNRALTIEEIEGLMEL